jgi:arylsulfatase A-like enzyme
MAIIYELKKGLVYCITSPDGLNKYIGSTSLTLPQRIAIHRYKTKHFGNTHLYRFFREVGFDNCKCEVLEEVMYNNKLELLQREKHYIDTVEPTLNKNQAGLNVKDNMKQYIKDYYDKEENKERRKQYNNKYYHEKNKEKLLEKVFCECCNKNISKVNMNQHYNSKKHLSVAVRQDR